MIVNYIINIFITRFATSLTCCLVFIVFFYFSVTTHCIIHNDVNSHRTFYIIHWWPCCLWFIFIMNVLQKRVCSMCTTLPTASPLYLNYKFLNVLNRSRILKDHNRAKLKVNLINNIKPIRVIIEYVSLNYISDIKRCFAEKIIYLYVMFDVLRGCSGSQPPRRPSHHGRMTLLYLLSTDINIWHRSGLPPPLWGGTPKRSELAIAPGKYFCIRQYT